MTDPWLLIGLTAQLIFTSRFLVQWYVSEKRGRSVIPVSFWYISLAGSLTLLAYAIHRRDPVFILGQGAGCVIYIRNLVLIDRRRRVLAGKTPRSTPWGVFAALLLPLVILTALCAEWVIDYRTVLRKPRGQPFHAESKRFEIETEHAFIRDVQEDHIEAWAMGPNPRLKLGSHSRDVSRPVVTLLNVDGDDVEVSGKLIDCHREVLTSGVVLYLTLPAKAEVEVYVEEQVLPEMTFVVGSDPRRNQTSFGWFLESVSAESPDFAVLLGDEANSARDHEYAVVEDRLLKTRVPFFLLPGDAEYRANRALDSYRARFGPPNYAFAAAEALFVFVNNTGKRLLPAALEWARRALDGHRELPLKFIFLHHPIASFPGTEDVTAMRSEDTERLLDLCREHRVTCVFSGEVHGSTQKTIDGTRFYACGGLDVPFKDAPHRFCFLRVHVRDGVAEVSTVDTDLVRGEWHLDNLRLLYYYVLHFSREKPVSFLLSLLALVLWVWLPVMTIWRFRQRRRLRDGETATTEERPDAS